MLSSVQSGSAVCNRREWGAGKTAGANRRSVSSVVPPPLHPWNLAEVSAGANRDSPLPFPQLRESRVHRVLQHAAVVRIHDKARTLPDRAQGLLGFAKPAPRG